MKTIIILTICLFSSIAFAWDDNECIKIIARGEHAIILSCDNHDYDYIEEADFIRLQDELEKVEKEFQREKRVAKGGNMKAKPNFCSEHCEVKKLIGEKRFWHKIWESKWTFWVVTGLALAFVSFNGWIITELSAQKTDTAITKQTNEQTHKDIKEIKEQNAKVEQERKQDVKELKEQNAKTEERRQQDKLEMMKMLIEIQKDLAKKK